MKWPGELPAITGCPPPSRPSQGTETGPRPAPPPSQHCYCLRQFSLQPLFPVRVRSRSVILHDIPLTLEKLWGHYSPQVGLPLVRDCFISDYSSLLLILLCDSPISSVPRTETCTTHMMLVKVAPGRP